MSFPEPFFRWRPHPWHGLEPGPDAPHVVVAYIELTPFDLVKYEVVKETGYLRVDRPQRSSSQPPCLYGFIPRTYCGDRVGALTEGARCGDGDPLDICVVSERPINRADVILNARVVGGLRMVDGGEADDKIIAVLESDNLWRDTRELSGVPDVLVERIEHYFSTYKWVPGMDTAVQILGTYDHNHAERVIEAALADYRDVFGS
jgi:inorganic pyrophosphatase